MSKIICIGKNYEEHARELAEQIGDRIPSKPVLFLKPFDVAKQSSSFDEVLNARFPLHRGVLHYECEIVLRLGDEGTLEAVTLGLDMTLRDLQKELKQKGHPWERSKVFTDSILAGPWIPLAGFPEYLNEPFTFSLEGKVCQTGMGAEMTLSPAECIAYAGENFPLQRGDWLFTGTPKGVGPVQAGQTGVCRWGEKTILSVTWSA